MEARKSINQLVGHPERYTNRSVVRFNLCDAEMTLDRFRGKRSMEKRSTQTSERLQELLETQLNPIGQATRTIQFAASSLSVPLLDGSVRLQSVDIPTDNPTQIHNDGYPNIEKCLFNQALAERIKHLRQRGLSETDTQIILKLEGHDVLLTEEQDEQSLDKGKAKITKKRRHDHIGVDIDIKKCFPSKGISRGAVGVGAKMLKGSIDSFPLENNIVEVPSRTSKFKEQIIATDEGDPDSKIESIEISFIKQNQMTIQALQNTYGFKNYFRGTPSSKLYLKNLACSTSEKHLRELFLRFQQPDGPKIQYRLMQKGRMKGQAFVTFPSIAIATNALDLINGYILEGKPIIVSFGNSSS